jgi:hypothetical protein
VFAIQIESREVAKCGFWNLLEWCRLQGADEFTFNLSGRGAEAFARLVRRIDDRLSRFARPPEPRIAVNTCIWYQRDGAVLYSLSPESIDELRAFRMERLFEVSEWPAGTTLQDAIAMMSDRAYLTSLCVYKEKVPILAVFDEDGYSMTLVLTETEKQNLDAALADVEYEQLDNHFPDLFMRRDEAPT